MPGLDQFYTEPNLAAKLFGSLTAYDAPDRLWIEPSAGSGSFYDLLPSDRRIGYDIEPKAIGVIESDFLEVITPSQNWIAVGNPPFGKNSSLAVRFFNHCAGADVIAMIVPRTFRKPSVINRLDSAFHLVSDLTLPPYSFVYEGEPYDVPCCFQIWERRSEARAILRAPTTHDDFAFVKRHEGEFAVQRVGANAGRVKDISPAIADASHYFIRGPVRHVFEAIRYSSSKHDTAGNPSISKGEIISHYVETKFNLGNRPT